MWWIFHCQVWLPDGRVNGWNFVVTCWDGDLDRNDELLGLHYSKLREIDTPGILWNLNDDPTVVRWETPTGRWIELWSPEIWAAPGSYGAVDDWAYWIVRGAEGWNSGFGVGKFLGRSLSCLSQTVNNHRAGKMSWLFFLPSFLGHIGASILGHIWGFVKYISMTINRMIHGVVQECVIAKPK